MNPTEIIILKVGETPQNTPRQEKAQVEEIITMINQGKDLDLTRNLMSDHREIIEIDKDQDLTRNHINKEMDLPRTTT